MSVLSDFEIVQRAKEGMISPFEPELVRSNQSGKIISFGTSSYGYDARVAKEFKVFTNINNSIVDPKDFSSDNFVDKETDCLILPPNSFAFCTENINIVTFKCCI